MLHSRVWSDDEGFFFLSCRVVEAYQDAAAATAAVAQRIFNLQPIAFNN